MIGAIRTFWGQWATHSFRIYGHHEDFRVGDCASVTFELKLDRSNTADASGCPTGYTSMVFTKVMNSCTGGDDDYLFAGSFFGGTYGNDNHRSYYHSTVTSTGDEASQSDQGCWELATEYSCEIL